MCFGKLRKSGEPNAGDCLSVDSMTTSGMMWTDNCWLCTDNREKLICVANNIIEELMDLDMEPKPNHCGGQARTKVRKRTHSKWEADTESWISPSVRSLMYWDTVFIVMGKGSTAPSAPCARPCEAGGVTNTSTV